MQFNKILLAAVIAMAAATTAPLLQASPSGLNNIPTADVAPVKVLVFQGYGNLSSNSRPDWWAGFKFGAYKNLELGFDARVNPDDADAEAYALQANYRIDLHEKTALGLGVANLGDRAHNGYEDYYGVLTHDLEFARLHLGYSFQKNNETVFGGIDKTIPVFERGLTLRSDVRQVADRDDTMISAGLMYDLGNNFIVESWVSHLLDDNDADEVYTVKLNYVIKF